MLRSLFATVRLISDNLVIFADEEERCDFVILESNFDREKFSAWAKLIRRKVKSASFNLRGRLEIGPFVFARIFGRKSSIFRRRFSSRRAIVNNESTDEGISAFSSTFPAGTSGRTNISLTMTNVIGSLEHFLPSRGFAKVSTEMVRRSVR